MWGGWSLWQVSNANLGSDPSCLQAGDQDSLNRQPSSFTEGGWTSWVVYPGSSQ